MNFLQPLEFSNQRILTTEQLADAYKVDTKIISNNFNNNKKRYLEGKHYYFLDGEDLHSFRDLYGDSVVVDRTPKLYLWTERGAALHAKSLNNDRAWEIYEQLVDNYFRLREFTKEILRKHYLKDIEDKLIGSFVNHLSKDSTIDNLLVRATIAHYSGLLDIDTLEDVEREISALDIKPKIYDSSECIYILKQLAQLVDYGLLRNDTDYKLMKFQGVNAIAFGACMYDSLVCNRFNLNYVGNIPSRFSFFSSLERKKYFLGYVPVTKGMPYRNESKWIVLNLDLLSQKMQVLKFGYIPLDSKSRTASENGDIILY